MQTYTREVYLNGIKELAKQFETLTDGQLDKLHSKVVDIVELVRLYEIENKNRKKPKSIRVEKRVSPKVADILYVIEMEGKVNANIGREDLLEHLKFMTDNFNRYSGKAELFKYQKVEKIQ